VDAYVVLGGEQAMRNMKRIDALGFAELPICMAKTPVTLSDDPSRRGRPRSFFITTQSVRVAAGAGFNVVRMGEISLMPGLPKRPAAERIELGDNGTITGIF
jgi:formate--tetrahydrofolate ligase